MSFVYVSDTLILFKKLSIRINSLKFNLRIKFVNIKNKRTFPIIPRNKPFKKTLYLIPSWILLLVAIPTVNRSCSIRFEWNFSFLSTSCTCYFVHFTRWSVVAASVFAIHLYYSFIYLAIYWP